MADENTPMNAQYVQSKEDHDESSDMMIPDSILAKVGVKQCLVVGEEYCLVKALAIGKHWSDMKTATTPEEAALHKSEYLRCTRVDRNPKFVQHQAAIDLLEDAGLEVNRDDHTLDKLSDFLSDYRITVWTIVSGVDNPTITFDKNRGAKGFISLYCYNGRFDFFHPTVNHVRVRYCYMCNTLVNSHHHKRCQALCKRCGFPGCEKEFSNTAISCPECERLFPNQKCHDQHLKKKSMTAQPYCKLWTRCSDCTKIYHRYRRRHVCTDYGEYTRVFNLIDGKCGRCGSKECEQTTSNLHIVCEKCKKSFPSKKCYDLHLQRKCGRWQKCQTCCRIRDMSNSRFHKCGLPGRRSQKDNVTVAAVDVSMDAISEAKLER